MSTWVHLKIIISEVRERQISNAIDYMQNLKKTDTNELIYKTETLTDLKNEFMITRSKEAEIDW